MKIHFIGIGGIGVSALAKFYFEKGNEISGSDLFCSEITDELKRRGIKIFIGEHSPKNLPLKIDLVIYSPAIAKSNPELKEAKKRKIKILSYPEALGDLTKKYFTIAVCGTHGKSTTTGLIGLILTKAGFDPTVIVGTKFKQFGNSNCRVGNSNYLVIEADEHFESFLNYWPQIIVLTSLEKDHLDYFKNFKNYILAFKKFISHLPQDGYLVANSQDHQIRSKITPFFKNVIPYSLKQKEAKKIKKLLKIPGPFNVSNALAALTVARILNIEDKISFSVFSKYKGSWRRLDERKILFNWKKIILIHDYAHHPTEIKLTLKAIQEKYKKNKIYCIFQPHQYQRTKFLFGDFVEALKKVKVNVLILTDIYSVAGREEEKVNVSSEMLVEKINKKNVIYVPQVETALTFLKKIIKNKDILVCLGAGDIYSRVQYFFKSKMS